ncbi:MAG: prolyl oligopeptidase family serine peptidase [Planctomycetota bacterium]
MSIVAVAFACLFAPQQPEAVDLRQELARAVDLPTASAREKAADELAKKHPASLAEWTAECATFGAFEAKEPGPTRQTVELHVLDQVEATEIFLLVPRGYDPRKPAPLLLWGHGAGGSGAREYMLWQDTADKVGILVLAATEFGKEPGWGFMPRERAAQLAVLRWARRTVNVDENAIFVGGWSRGGHMTWDLMQRFPDLFAGALPVVGGPRMQMGEQNNLRYLENVAHLPIRDLQGSQDDALLVMNLRLAFARLKKLSALDAVLHEFPDRGHDADLAVVDWVEFFTRRREAKPERVVRLATQLSEARTRWAQITAFDEKVAVEVPLQVDPRTWEGLDELGQRAFALDKLVDRTARLVVVDKGKGRFVAEGRGVKSFELRLAPAQIGKDGAVEVRWQNCTVRKKLEPDLGVLLREFVERFDRTFLPVARLVVQ